MTKWELILAIILFVLAGILLMVSICHYLEKGLILHYAYMRAAPEERKKLNKRTYYRKSAIVFLQLSLGIAAVGLAVVLHLNDIDWMEIPLVAVCEIVETIT